MLTPWKKSYYLPRQHIKKHRPLLTKVRLVKAMVFLVVMYGCESWTLKKAEHWRTAAFELWCWRTLLRVPWTAKRSNQSILKEISPDYSLEGLMPKLKLQYFGHPMPTADSLEKTLMLGKIEVRRRRGQQRTRRLNGITDSMDMSLSKLREIVKDRGTSCVRGVEKSGTWLSDWTTSSRFSNVIIYCRNSFIFYNFPCLFFLFCVFLFLLFLFLLEYSGFTLLCQFLVYSSESATCIHILPLFWIFFPFRSPQSTNQSSL